MARQFLFNDTAAPKIMGGKLVPPGEGREVDDVHMPPGEGADALGALLADEPDAEAAAREAAAGRLKNLQDLLANPLSHILPGLAEHSDETLTELATVEAETDTPRKTLLDAIAGLQLKRAQEKAGGAPT